MPIFARAALPEEAQPLTAAEEPSSSSRSSFAGDAQSSGSAELQLLSSQQDVCSSPAAARSSADGEAGRSGGAVACRVCLEEDAAEQLVQPCACRGSMQYAHQACVQAWINEKGNKVCEVCKAPFRGDWADPPPRPQPAALPYLPFFQPLRGILLAADPETGALTTHAHAEAGHTEEARQLGAAWCLSAILIFLSMLLLRHVLDTLAPVGAGGTADGGGGASGPHHADPSAGTVEEVGPGLLLLWLGLRLAVVLLPIYAVLRVMGALRDSQLADAREAALERDLAALLWTMEAGLQHRAAQMAAAAVPDTPVPARGGPAAGGQPRAGDLQLQPLARI